MLFLDFLDPGLLVSDQRMENVSPLYLPARVQINGNPVMKSCGVRLDYRPPAVLLPERERVTLHTFNSIEVLLPELLPERERVTLHTFNSIEVLLPERERVTIQAFNSTLIGDRSTRQEVDRFTFDGTNLGLYHDTADPREGPYVNHYLNHIEVSIAHPSDLEAQISIFGEADLAESSFDSYWYKGPTSGRWSFEVSFVYPYPDS